MEISAYKYLLLTTLLLAAVAIFGCKDRLPEKNAVPGAVDASEQPKDTLDAEEEDALLNDTISSGEDLP